MADKYWHEGGWYYAIEWGGWRYVRPGYYEAGTARADEDFLHLLSSTEVRSLIRKLDEEGWIKPRLDERLRTEDLKITHRLLDIIEKHDS